MDDGALRVNLHIDGGSRGNPGPAASGFVITDEHGAVVAEAGLFLGEATNNVAEYRGLLGGLEAARDKGAKEVAVFSDSELLVRQMLGQYRVKNEKLRELYEKAQILKAGFARVTFKHVPREQNTYADRLVNQALNLKRNV